MTIASKGSNTSRLVGLSKAARITKRTAAYGGSRRPKSTPSGKRRTAASRRRIAVSKRRLKRFKETERILRESGQRADERVENLVLVIAELCQRMDDQRSSPPRN